MMRAGRLIASPGCFRLLLAYTVVVAHFTSIHLGLAAVFVFFMLSGYWVYQMWNQEYAQTSSPYSTFVMSRLWRLLPMYLVTLVLFVALAVTFRGTPMEKAFSAAPSSGWPAVHFWLSYLIIVGSATLPENIKFLFQMWSLDIELQFYFIAPFIIKLVSKRSLGSWPRLAVYGVCLAALAIYVIGFNGLIRFGLPQSAPLPMYLFFFLIGLESARRPRKPPLAVALGGLSAACGLIALCLATPTARPVLMYTLTASKLTDCNAAFSVVIALLLFAYAMATVRNLPAKGTFFAKLDRDLGNVSYEVYLLHVNVLWAMTFLYGQLPEHVRLAILTLAAVALFPLSWLIYAFLDRPIDKQRRAWVRSRASLLVDRYRKPVTPALASNP
jgi:peptidoglycan/LPS O-acetylase OafA/YrhL